MNVDDFVSKRWKISAMCNQTIKKKDSRLYCRYDHHIHYHLHYYNNSQHQLSLSLNTRLTYPPTLSPERLSSPNIIQRSIRSAFTDLTKNWLVFGNQCMDLSQSLKFQYFMKLDELARFIHLKVHSRIERKTQRKVFDDWKYLGMPEWKFKVK